MAPSFSKRRHEVIDLTGDDHRSAPHRKVPRYSTSAFEASASTSRHPSPQPTPRVRSSSYQAHQTALSTTHSPGVRDSWSDAREDIDQSQEFIESGNDAYYGTWHHKIVGVRYYNGIATPGEVVCLHREPGNPYDSNAIRVNNVVGDQIGHLPRGLAASLASFLDSRSIDIVATLAGQKTFYEAPIDLKLFGPSDQVAAAALMESLRSAGIPKAVLASRQREQKQLASKRKAEALKRAASLAKSTGKQQRDKFSNGSFSNLAQGSANGDGDDALDMDNIMHSAIRFSPREIGQVADKYSAGEDALSKLPFAKQPTDLATKLLPYQLQGLAWMLDRESPSLPERDSDRTTQLWKANRNGTYTNLATNYTMKKPSLASGGILADDMGLGKTIQVLALLAADPRPRREPTLIVSPLSVMSNWALQAATHMSTKKQLRVLTYHGANRSNQTAKDFEEYDIVVTTYQTLAQEYMPAGKRKDPEEIPRWNGLFSISWRRVVLDEGHTIRSPKTKMTQAAYSLMANSRWVLTGTPIVNNLRDLYSHVKFLRLTGGLEQQEVFNSTLVRPLSQGLEEGSMLLRALMTTLCLRRMKDMKFINLKLPELSSHRYNVKFLAHEKERYDAFMKEAQGLLTRFQSGDKTKGQSTYSHLLEVLLRMRQTCNHWKLCGERATSLLKLIEEDKKVTMTPENVKTLQDILQLSIDQQEDCPVCFETLHEPAITACAHVFGGPCIERVIELQHKCPMCRAELSATEELVRPREEENETSHIDLDSSSKANALLDILKASRKKSAATKTVVFSQWTSFLNILQPHLGDAGFKFCRLDGTMNAARRDDAMNALAKDPACTVMLASLGVCSVGLNLVAANQVILADSWWAPAIEDQAVDRVHRLGQTRATTVFRLVMEDSIEERVLGIQSDKRKLMTAAFGEEKERRGEKSARLADIEKLLQ